MERVPADRAWPLWWLPLLAGALPALGVAIAFPIAVSDGYFAACNPLLDGCVSISRAARHGLANHLFRALLLPAAVLQGAVWCLCGPWLHGLDARTVSRIRWLPWVGIAAAGFLILYGTFLGTEGTWYRWMRRYGVVFYFGFTCILMLLVAGAAGSAARTTGRHRRTAQLMMALCLALPLLGIVNSLAPVLIADPVALDRFENATEWWGGLVFSLFFTLLAFGWWRTGYAARLGPPLR